MPDNESPGFDALIGAVVGRYDKAVRRDTTVAIDAVRAVAFDEDGNYGVQGEILDIAESLGAPISDRKFLEALRQATEDCQARLRDELSNRTATSTAIAGSEAELHAAEAIAAEARAAGAVDLVGFHDVGDANAVVHDRMAALGPDALADLSATNRVTATVDLLLAPNIVTHDDSGNPLRCGDCGRPMAYDYLREAYRHLVDPGRGCFLIRAKTPVETPAHRTRPLLRPTGANAPAPPGWIAVPAGRNPRGEELEVIYDPGRYDVLVVHGERGGMFPRLAQEASADLMLDALAVTGWELHNFAGEPRVWIRDRAAAERLAFEHREAGQQPEVQFNDLGPTRPFLRSERSISSIPPGWIAEPAGVAGTSGDILVEVVYNPQRHDVMRVAHGRAEAILAALADQGWTRASTDATSHLLWRDRVAHVRTSLEHPVTHAADIEIEGPGL